MSLSDKLRKFWPFGQTDENRIKQLLHQIDQASEDLKFRMAENLARISDIERRIAEESEKIQHADASERLEFYGKSLSAEKNNGKRLKQILSDLHEKRKNIEFSFQQILARIRNAETLNLVADLQKDFGEEMSLNNYFNKLSEESFKIEFTAESRLRIESKLFSEE